MTKRRDQIARSNAIRAGKLAYPNPPICGVCGEKTKLTYQAGAWKCHRCVYWEVKGETPPPRRGYPPTPAPRGPRKNTGRPAHRPKKWTPNPPKRCQKLILGTRQCGRPASKDSPFCGIHRNEES